MANRHKGQAQPLREAEGSEVHKYGSQKRLPIAQNMPLSTGCLRSTKHQEDKELMNVNDSNGDNSYLHDLGGGFFQEAEIIAHPHGESRNGIPGGYGDFSHKAGTITIPCRESIPGKNVMEKYQIEQGNSESIPSDFVDLPIYDSESPINSPRLSHYTEQDSFLDGLCPDIDNLGCSKENSPLKRQAQAQPVNSTTDHTNNNVPPQEEDKHEQTKESERNRKKYATNVARSIFRQGIKSGLDLLSGNNKEDYISQELNSISKPEKKSFEKFLKKSRELTQRINSYESINRYLEKEERYGKILHAIILRFLEEDGNRDFNEMLNRRSEGVRQYVIEEKEEIINKFRNFTISKQYPEQTNDLKGQDAPKWRITPRKIEQFNQFHKESWLTGTERSNLAKANKGDYNDKMEVERSNDIVWTMGIQFFRDDNHASLTHRFQINHKKG